MLPVDLNSRPSEKFRTIMPQPSFAWLQTESITKIHRVLDMECDGEFEADFEMLKDTLNEVFVLGSQHINIDAINMMFNVTNGKLGTTLNNSLLCDIVENIKEDLELNKFCVGKLFVLSYIAKEYFKKFKSEFLIKIIKKVPLFDLQSSCALLKHEEIDEYLQSGVSKLFNSFLALPILAEETITYHPKKNISQIECMIEDFTKEFNTRVRIVVNFDVVNALNFLPCVINGIVQQYIM